MSDIDTANIIDESFMDDDSEHKSYKLSSSFWKSLHKFEGNCEIWKQYKIKLIKIYVKKIFLPTKCWFCNIFVRRIF